jgi:hypothetical protein
MAQGRPGYGRGQAQPAQTRPPWRPVAHGWHEDRHDPRKRKRRKPRKGLLREVFEEAFDVLDDIFD